MARGRNSHKEARSRVEQTKSKLLSFSAGATNREGKHRANQAVAGTIRQRS
jgi:hypothetical protein